MIKLIRFILIIIFTGCVLPQSTFTDFSFATRPGDNFLYSHKVFSSAFARYLSVPLLSSHNDRYSSIPTLKINDIEISTFAFNFNSPDLIPLDLINLKNIVVNKDVSINQAGHGELGSLNYLLDEISGDFKCKTRVYMGSETGDPLIHIYTRQNENKDLININKIIPSGSVSIENTVDKFQYRFTTGYFGSFATGSINDELINNISSYYYAKQNKQFLASVESNYNPDSTSSLAFTSGFISFYGWDLPPYFNRVIHFETYNHFADLRYKNTRNNFSIYLRNEGSTGFTNKQQITLETGLQKVKYVLGIQTFLLSSPNASIKITPEIEYVSAHNIKESSTQFLKQKVNKLKPNLSLNSNYNFASKMTANINLNAFKTLNDNIEISGEISTDYSVDQNNEFRISAASISKQLSAELLYGQFNSLVNSVSDPDLNFSISGNSKLKNERINSLGLEYKYISNLYKLFFNISYNHISNKIFFANYPDDSTKTKFSYFNSRAIKYCQSELALLFNLFRNSTINLTYTYSNKDIYTFTPNHLLGVSSILSVWESTNLMTSCTYYSKNNSSGSEPYELTDKIIFNIGVSKILYNFYLPENLSLSIKMENVFNNKIRFLPSGNFLGRAFVFNLNMEF